MTSCEVASNEGRYRHYWNELPCYLSVHDRDLRIIDGNHLFCRDFGERIGERCYGVYKRRSEECPDCPVRATFDDGENHCSEQVLITLAGEPRPVMVHTTPILDERRRVVSVMEMHTDIREVKRMQSRLSELGLFLSTVSHSIKGLLTGLDGGIYLVETGFASGNAERLQKGWGMVVRNIGLIRDTVTNTLYYAKDRPLEIAPVHVVQLVQELRGLILDRARELGVVVSTRIDERTTTVAADASALRTMLLNLMENALDACYADRTKDRHTVTLVVRTRSTSVVFEVSDDGVGIDPTSLRNLFEPFFSTKGPKGTGLGLHIASSIAAKHGGSIDVDSTPGQGSRFRVYLPLESRPAGAKVVTRCTAVAS